MRELRNPYNSLEEVFSLRGKVAVVTGAAGFLGRALSEALLLAGAQIVLLGRGPKICDYAACLEQRYGAERVESGCVDFYQENEFRQQLAGIAERHDTVDVLVNNAFEFSRSTGFNDPSGKMESISKSQWMTSLEASVYWPALATQVIAEKMKRQRRGSIINIGSMYGIVSQDPDLYVGTEIFNPPSYGAGKAAMLALTRYTAAFLGPYNIRCNAIVPGAFPNVDGDSYNSPKDDGFVGRLSTRTVLKRYGQPSDLMGAVIFLASDSSSYMTGQALVIDGGWTVK